MYFKFIKCIKVLWFLTGNNNGNIFAFSHSGSIDGNNQLVIKGRFQQKQIENVLRRYISKCIIPSSRSETFSSGCSILGMRENDNDGKVGQQGDFLAAV